jgi:hypothetical protein
MKVNPQMVEKLKETASQVIGAANNPAQERTNNAKHTKDEVIKIDFQNDTRKATETVNAIEQKSSGALNHQLGDNSYGNRELGIA